MEGIGVFDDALSIYEADDGERWTDCRAPLPEEVELPPSPPPGSPSSFTRSMTTLHTADLEEYYLEFQGRLYSTEFDHLLMPADAEEISRMIDFHENMKMVIGGNYRGPVRRVLDIDDERQLRGLDIWSMSPWADEMAREFPHVKWTGVDFVPTRHPARDNVEYEIYDFTKGLRYRDATFDIVHTRNSFIYVENYAYFLREIRRVLRPGGVFLWANTQYDTFMEDRSEPSEFVPGVMRMAALIKRFLAMRNVAVDNVPRISSMVRAVGGFRDPSHAVVCVPNSDWDKDDWRQQEIGLKSRQGIISYLVALGPALRSGMGMSEEETTELTRAVHAELSDPDVHCFHQYHTFYAIRDST